MDLARSTRGGTSSGGVLLALSLVGFGCAVEPAKNVSASTTNVPSAAANDPEDRRPPEGGGESLFERPLCGEETDLCRDVRRAEALLRAGRAMEAEALFVELVTRFPESFEARVGLARSMAAEESFAYGTGGEDAQRALDVLLSMNDELRELPLVRLERARLELCLGRASVARETLLALRREWPREPEVHGALGVALLAEGRVRESLEPLGRAVVLAPKDAERRLVLGSARMLVEDLEGAEDAFRGALALEPDSAKGHADLGTLLLLRGRSDEARAHLERSLSLGGERATLLTNLSYAALLTKDFESARRHALRAVELEPNFGSAWLNLGLAEAALGQLPAARDAFLRAKHLDPEDPRVAPNLADLDELERTKR